MWKSSSILYPPLTSVYEADKSTLTFSVGDNIDIIIISDSSNKYSPKYATAGSPINLSDVSLGTKYILTVVPKRSYKFQGWDIVKDTNSQTLTAFGEEGSYESMQEMTADECPILDDKLSNAKNVTDQRDGKSYAVAKINNHCFMLSNLRLDGQTLNSSTSDVSSSYTLPSAWAIHKAAMKIIDNEYFYNWRAAIANTNSGETAGGINGSTSDGLQSSTSVCPKNWTLPNYNDDIIPSSAWNSGQNPAMLYTSGYIQGGEQGNHYNAGAIGYFWSRQQSYSFRNATNDTCGVGVSVCFWYYRPYYLFFNSSSISRSTPSGYHKYVPGSGSSQMHYYYGFAYDAASVRCLLKS